MTMVEARRARPSERAPAIATLLLAGALTLMVAPGAHADRTYLSVVGASATPPLGAWERGHLRRYLSANSQACSLPGKKRAAVGDVSVQLDVAGARPPKVAVKTRQPALRRFAGCLRAGLGKVSFAALAPAFRWRGTLRLGASPTLKVRIAALQGIDDEEEMEQLALAALEQPAACMDRVFAAEPALSQVVIATLDANETGALRAVEVAESTGGSEETLACVRTQLSALSFRVQRAVHAKLVIALLRRTTTDTDEPAKFGR
jgi:hypothetical protein